LILLDENILDGQRLLLEASGVAARQIGVDVGRKGMKDDEVVVFLRRKRNIIFSPAIWISICRSYVMGAIAWS
jgi:hypothetical protein